jgi:hypothetical protein
MLAEPEEFAIGFARQKNGLAALPNRPAQKSRDRFHRRVAPVFVSMGTNATGHRVGGYCFNAVLCENRKGRLNGIRICVVSQDS